MMLLSGIGKPGKRAPVPEPEIDCEQAIQRSKGVGRYSEEGRRALFRALRVAAHLRYPAKRRRVADHMVTQMLRQEDADAFKLYSQAKLGMMREALANLDRQANERAGNLFTERAS